MRTMVLAYIYLQNWSFFRATVGIHLPAPMVRIWVCYLEVRARWPQETASRGPRSSQGAAVGEAMVDSWGFQWGLTQ